MRWIYISGTDVQFTLSAAGVGLQRYDLITVKLEDIDGDSEPRDFKDGVTGALSTSSLSKKRAVRATFDVTQGTAAASPTIPSVPAGVQLVFVVKVDNTQITEVRDCTFPVGRPTMSSLPLNRLALYSSAGVDWTLETGGRLTATGFVNSIHIPAGPAAGDPTARLIGFQIRYKLSAGTLMSMVRGRYDAGITAVASLAANLEASLTLDNTDRTATIDLRGHPNNTKGPCWGNGKFFKEFRPTDGEAHEALMLDVKAGAAGDRIYSINWIVAKG
jgi:hypothetical protein